MKVGLLLFSDFPDGAALGRRTYLLAKGFARARHDVDVIVAQRFQSGPRHEALDGFRVSWAATTTPGEFHRLSERLRARWGTMKLVQALTRAGLDWLVIVFPELDRLPHLLMARRRGTRIAVSYEDERTLPPNPTLRDRYLATRGRLADRVFPRLCDLTLPTSRLLESRLRARAPRTPSFLLPALVDTSTFRFDEGGAASFRDKWHLGDAPVISYLGTYWHVEGLANLLHAAAEMRALGTRFRLVISGKQHAGHRCDNVASIAKSLGIQDLLVETGWLPTTDVVAAMSVADILVVPKIEHTANAAGLPAKLAEYLSVGRPVVASNVGDISQYVNDGDDALLCKPGDIRALRDCLTSLLQDEPLRRKLAANARRAALREFDYETVAANAADAMSCVAGGRPVATHR